MGQLIIGFHNYTGEFTNDFFKGHGKKIIPPPSRSQGLLEVTQHKYSLIVYQEKECEQENGCT